MKKNESRRTAIKKMVAGLGGIPLITSLSGFDTSKQGKPIPVKSYGNKDIDKPITEEGLILNIRKILEVGHHEKETKVEKS